MESERKKVSPAVVAFAGWLVPGLGYWLLGERARGVVVGATTLLLFFAGLLVAGVRVIEVPGYDDRGEKIEVQTGPRSKQWIMLVRPHIEIANKPWYVGQILLGPVN